VLPGACSRLAAGAAAANVPIPDIPACTGCGEEETIVIRRRINCDVVHCAIVVQLIKTFEPKAVPTGERAFDKARSGGRAGLKLEVGHVAIFEGWPRVRRAVTDHPIGPLVYEFKYRITVVGAYLAKIPDYVAKMLKLMDGDPGAITGIHHNGIRICIFQIPFVRVNRAG
jgi:hypothetical protein